jgi:hypothetical protein
MPCRPLLLAVSPAPPAGFRGVAPDGFSQAAGPGPGGILLRPGGANPRCAALLCQSAQGSKGQQRPWSKPLPKQRRAAFTGRRVAGAKPPPRGAWGWDKPLLLGMQRGRSIPLPSQKHRNGASRGLPAHGLQSTVNRAAALLFPDYHRPIEELLTSVNAVGAFNFYNEV